MKIDEQTANLIDQLEVLRGHIQATGNQKTKEALAHVEGFLEVAVRVMKKANPSKIRSEAKTAEIAMLLRRQS